MDLAEVVTKLQTFAPLSLAEKWDNVGLLVEPTPPHSVQTILVTNDLTEPVMNEAKAKDVSMVISYHPPIFRPLTKLTSASWKERIILECVEQRIAVFSPHTAFDAVSGGVNDWLIDCFKPTEGDFIMSPITSRTSMSTLSGEDIHIEFDISDHSREANKMLDHLRTVAGIRFRCIQKDDQLVLLGAKREALSEVLKILDLYPSLKQRTELLEVSKPLIPGAGAGRLAVLDVAQMNIGSAVTKLKAHLELPHLRCALAQNHSMETLVKSVAVCAGSGSSVLTGVQADLYVTGEMSHHDILQAVHHGTSVILCEHSNSERGFLREFCLTLEKLLDGKVNVFYAECDRDPVEVV